MSQFCYNLWLKKPSHLNLHLESNRHWNFKDNVQKWQLNRLIYVPALSIQAYNAAVSIARSQDPGPRST